MQTRVWIEFTGRLNPSQFQRGDLPGDDGIIDHGDGTFSVPAGSPRIRPYAMLKQSADEAAQVPQ